MPRVKYLHHPQHFCSLPKIMKTENCHQEQGHKQNYRILLCETLRFGINFQSPVLFRNVNKSKIFTCSIEQHLVFTCNFIYRPKKTQQSLHISIYHPLFSSTAILQSSIFKSQIAKTSQIARYTQRWKTSRITICSNIIAPQAQHTTPQCFP